MDTDELKLAKMVMPYAIEQQMRMREQGGKFVHYTSAEAGLLILRGNSILLRNSTLMNDFSEVAYGMDCLSSAYGGPVGERLKAVMRAVQPDLPEIFENNYNAAIGDIRQETYLLSISEHGGEWEDRFGRLSMWRAYAARNGIAFVFKNTPFLADTNALQAFTSPVMYATPETFEAHVEDIVGGLEANSETLQKLGGQWLHDTLQMAFVFAIQSTKHPSFQEEREWRVIYSPTTLFKAGGLTTQQLERVPTEIMCLNSVPQRVFRIPFRDYPDEGFEGATVPALLDRVLIGPSLDAHAIAQAFIAELGSLGVENAGEKVMITGIPLRQ